MTGPADQPDRPGRGVVFHRLLWPLVRAATTRDGEQANRLLAEIPDGEVRELLAEMTAVAGMVARDTAAAHGLTPLAYADWLQIADTAVHFDEETEQ